MAKPLQRVEMDGAPSSDGDSTPTPSDEPVDDEVVASPRRWPILVVVLAALGLSQVFDRLTPKDRAVSLSFESPAEIRSVDLAWTDGDGEELASSRWTFVGGAPRRLSTRVRVRRGDYKARIAVQRRGGALIDSEHAVRFEGAEETTISVP